MIVVYYRSMRLLSGTVLAFLLLGIFMSVGVQAASDDGKPSPLRPGRFGVWVGISHDSPAGEFWGETPGRDFHEVGLQATWRLLDRPYVRVDYALDLIPFAMVTGNPRYRFSGASFNGFRERWISAYETKYGVGIAPIGLMVGVPVSRALCIFGSGSLGVLAFESEVPTPNASATNFTLAFGLGLEVLAGERWSMIFGYKLHHMSNGDRAYENPGIDSNVYYMGARWRR